MNRLLQALLYGPPCAEVLTGAATEQRPVTDNERQINAWRRQQYQHRLERYIRRQENPYEAEKKLVRKYETGLILLAAWNYRWTKKRLVGKTNVLQLADRKGAR